MAINREPAKPWTLDLQSGHIIISEIIGNWSMKESLNLEGISHVSISLYLLNGHN